MSAPVLYRGQGYKPDGSRYELLVRRVPVSDDYPEGVRYSFQYMAADGSTLLRYDNYVEKDAGRHHIHLPDGTIVGTDFEGWRAHLRRFKQQVDERYDDRTQP